MKSHRDALLVEAHRLIADAARDAVAKLAHPVGSAALAYPPEPVLTDAEGDALAALVLSDAARSGLRKLIADACASSLFHLFCLIDGVADPEVAAADDDWLGLDLVEPVEDGDRQMLHDDLFESYWQYKQLVDGAA